MIDIQSLVFDRLYTAIAAQYPSANVTTAYVDETAIFPAVVLEQVDNVPLMYSQTDDNAENHARITFEVAVYSDKKDTAESECSDLLQIVDNVMSSMKFRRTRRDKSRSLTRTIFRQYARYSVIVSQPQEINGNTVYNMYRR